MSDREANMQLADMNVVQITARILGENAFAG